MKKIGGYNVGFMAVFMVDTIDAFPTQPLIGKISVYKHCFC